MLPPDAPLATHPDDGRGRPGRPGVRGPDQVRRAGLHQGAGRRAGRREGLGRSSRTATAGGGSCRRPSRGASSRSARSAGCSSTDVVVICAGGGGVPDDVPARAAERTLVGVEAVIDKDLASELLAREVAADLFVMATDVDARLRRLGDAASSAAIGRITVAELRQQHVPGGLDGAEGRGGLPLRRGDRRARRDRRARPRSRQIVDGDAGTQVVAGVTSAERNGGEMTTFGVHSEVGRAPEGDGAPARAQPAAADPDRTTTTCCSTTCCGSSARSTSTTSSSRGCASAVSRCSCSRTCSGRRSPRATRGGDG